MRLKWSCQLKLQLGRIQLFDLNVFKREKKYTLHCKTTIYTQFVLKFSRENSSDIIMHINAFKSAIKN
jgi:hypothetical protein